MTGRPPLAGQRVVEMAGLEGVQYAGRLLAQLGADVIKVEPEGGDPLRTRPPLVATDDGAEWSVPFEFFNAGKRSVVVRAGEEDLARRLLSSATIVLYDPAARPQVATTERSPGQLRVLAGAFGGDAGGDRPTTVLTRFHSSTTGYLTPSYKDASARPSWSGPYVFECMYGVGIALAVVAERFRENGGDVDFSYQGYGVWLDKMIFHLPSLQGLDLNRIRRAYPFGGNVACADGHVALFAIEEHQWRGLCHMIGRDGWLGDPDFASGTKRLLVQDRIDAALGAWCAGRTADAVIAAARSHNVPIGRVRRPDDAASAGVVRPGFVAEQRTNLGPVVGPQLPFGPDLPAVALEPAPALGRHTDNLVASLLAVMP